MPTDWRNRAYDLKKLLVFPLPKGAEQLTNKDINLIEGIFQERFHQKNLSGRGRADARAYLIRLWFATITDYLLRHISEDSNNGSD